MTELTIARFHELEKHWSITKLLVDPKVFHLGSFQGPMKTVCGRWWPLVPSRYHQEGDRLCPMCERLVEANDHRL